jgi:hypothetical protein
MPSPADAVVRAVLRQSMVVEIATRSPKGRPFVTPLWFVVDGGVLYLTTGPETRAATNLVQHPEVTLLFNGPRERRPEGVLRIKGAATRHHGLPSWRVLLRVAAKYYVAPGALPTELRNVRRWRLRRLFYGQAKGGFGYLRVVPGAAEFLPPP